MIMSTISSTGTRRGAGAAVRAVGRALLRGWVAYTAWRLERLAIARCARVDI
jgi:hypothetical protein